MYKKIKEGLAELNVPVEEKISKELPVFYNKVMKFNRDMSILVLNSIDQTDMQMAEPLAGSGVRGVRMALELKEGKAKSIEMNDFSPEAVKIINKNIKDNKLEENTNIQIKVHQEDANDFLLQSKGFDYIDIDPFGPPIQFLDSAIKRLSRCGILAVTATDTSALCGTFPKACRRKYWAEPTRTELMHEAGLRILIRRVQLIGAQYDRALTPIFSYSLDHYMRVFFACKKGKSRTDDIMNQHRVVSFGRHEDIGPLWTGQLHDIQVIETMIKNNTDESNTKRLNLFLDEAKANTLFFFDIHAIKKQEKISNHPKKEALKQKIIESGYKCHDTHFSQVGLKSDISYEEFMSILKQM